MKTIYNLQIVCSDTYIFNLKKTVSGIMKIGKVFVFTFRLILIYFFFHIPDTEGNKVSGEVAVLAAVPVQRRCTCDRK